MPQLLVLTQNVDGLHAAAGSSSLVEIHGNLRQLRCSRCQHDEEFSPSTGLEAPPRCPRCLAPLRPGVVLFGEALRHRALRKLGENPAESFDLIFSIGTSSLFPYITEPVLRGRLAGVPCVEINPGETCIRPLVDFHLRETAAEAMKKIWLALQCLER